MTLLEAIKKGIRKGSEYEAELSAALFSVICATLGSEAESQFNVKFTEILFMS